MSVNWNDLSWVKTDAQYKQPWPENLVVFTRAEWNVIRKFPKEMRVAELDYLRRLN